MHKLQDELLPIVKRRRNMDVRSIELFLHLTGSLHFAKTSQAMHVSPSTLSRVIQRLEQEVGTQLFIRDQRSVLLTHAGKQYQYFAQSWLQQWKQLQMDLSSNADQLAGELSIYCSVTAAYSHLPEILDKFRIVCPNADIKLATGDVAYAVEQVASGAVDIAIAVRPEQLPLNIAFTSIAKVPLTVIAPKVNCQATRLLNQNPTPWDKIPFILPEHGPAKSRIEQLFKAMRIKPNVCAKVAGHEAIVSMVALGSGLGIAPSVVVENSPVRERVQTISVGAQIESFDLGVCILSKRLHEPLMQRFWQTASI